MKDKLDVCQNVREIINQNSKKFIFLQLLLSDWKLTNYYFDLSKVSNHSKVESISKHVNFFPMINLPSSMQNKIFEVDVSFRN